MKVQVLLVFVQVESEMTSKAKKGSDILEASFRRHMCRGDYHRDLEPEPSAESVPVANGLHWQVICSQRLSRVENISQKTWYERHEHTRR